MNPKTIFKLHEPQHGIDEKHQNETYIHMFFSYGYAEIQKEKPISKKYIPLKYSTGKKIKPCYWEDRPIYRAKNNLSEETESLNQRLNLLEDEINSIYHKYENKGLMPTPGQLKDKLNQRLKERFNTPVRKLNDYIANFIIEAEQGKRRTARNTKYRKLSIKNLKGFYIQFRNYQETNEIRLNYEHITNDFLNDFINYFKQKGYSQNTIIRHIKHLRMIMHVSREEGLHDNMEIDSRYFRVRQVETENVYLTEEEMDRILKLDLSQDPSLELVRDVFLIGCYLGQRYGDYRNIKKSMLVNLEANRKGIRIFQSRTGKSVLIPLRPEAEFLLKKYRYNMPHTYEQLINKGIQDIAKIVGITDLKKTEVIINGRRVTKDVPKYKLIKTHTARRSGCVNMYLANISVNDIMTISGHQTVQDFLNYVRSTEIQVATKLANHPYFLNPEWGVAKMFK